MNDQDELREIWTSANHDRAANEEDIVTLMEHRMRQFDRRVTRRNLRECIAGVLVFGFFLWVAMREPNAIAKTGALIVAFSAAWIIFYLVRYGRSGQSPDPSQNLSSYTQALVERYDRQIRLLRSIKYWYLLPPYVGLLTITAGVLLEKSKVGHPSWWDAAYPALYTVFFAAVWWLNEVVVVRRLQQSRCKALSMTEAGEIQVEFTKEKQ